MSKQHISSLFVLWKPFTRIKPSLCFICYFPQLTYYDILPNFLLSDRSSSNNLVLMKKVTITQGKIYFLWIPSYICCNFTLGYSNFLLTRSNFSFPSDHFYITLPSLTRTMFWALCNLKQKKKPIAAQNIEPCIVIKLCSLIPFL